MNRRTQTISFVVALAVLALSALGFNYAIEHYNIYLQKKPIHPQPIRGEERLLRALPTETEHWRREGQDHIESADNEEVLGTSNYLSRTYIEKAPGEGKTPRVIQFHSAYYTGMIDTVPHVPERCFTGAGWSLVGGPWTVPIPLDSSLMRRADDAPDSMKGQLYTVRLSNQWSTSSPGSRVNLPLKVTPDTSLTLRVSEYAVPGTKQRMYAGYFFIANGGWCSSAEEVRLLAFDLRNDYAYYLKVQFSSSLVSSPEELAQAAASFLDDQFGEIMTCVPDWAEVQRGDWPPDNPKRNAPEQSRIKALGGAPEPRGSSAQPAGGS
jgi:hypothetical protein